MGLERIGIRQTIINTIGTHSDGKLNAIGRFLSKNVQVQSSQGNQPTQFANDQLKNAPPPDKNAPPPQASANPLAARKLTAFSDPSNLPKSLSPVSPSTTQPTATTQDRAEIAGLIRQHPEYIGDIPLSLVHDVQMTAQSPLFLKNQFEDGSISQKMEQKFPDGKYDKNNKEHLQELNNLIIDAKNNHGITAKQAIDFFNEVKTGTFSIENFKEAEWHASAEYAALKKLVEE